MTWYSPDWTAEERFGQAVTNDDLPMIDTLVAAGVSVNASSVDREPLLIMAARLQKPRSVAHLLRLGADVNTRGPLQETLIHHIAARESTLPLLDSVLGLGADIEEIDGNCRTPLMYALGTGFVPGARALLARGASGLAQDCEGSTTVFHLVHGMYPPSGERKPRRAPGLVSRLLSEWLDPAPDRTPERLRLLRELLALGVDPNAPGWIGRTAVTTAAERGMTEVLAVLQEGGADQERADGQGYTPLQAACWHGKPEAARWLLGQGVRQDYYSAVVLGDRPAVATALARDPSLARGVLDAARSCALGLAIRFGHADMVRLLLDHDADPRCPQASTPSTLHLAVRHLPDPAIITLPIEHGAEVDAGDGDNNTPLNFAARDDRIDLARALLEHGANPNITTERGYPVIDFARSEAMRELLGEYSKGLI